MPKRTFKEAFDNSINITFGNNNNNIVNNKRSFNQAFYADIDISDTNTNIDIDIDPECINKFKRMVFTAEKLSCISCKSPTYTHLVCQHYICKKCSDTVCNKCYLCPKCCDLESSFQKCYECGNGICIAYSPDILSTCGTCEKITCIDCGKYCDCI